MEWCASKGGEKKHCFYAIPVGRHDGGSFSRFSCIDTRKRHKQRHQSLYILTAVMSHHRRKYDFRHQHLRRSCMEPPQKCIITAMDVDSNERMHPSSGAPQKGQEHVLSDTEPATCIPCPPSLSRDIEGAMLCPSKNWARHGYAVRTIHIR